MSYKTNDALIRNIMDEIQDSYSYYVPAPEVLQYNFGFTASYNSSQKRDEEILRCLDELMKE